MITSTTKKMKATLGLHGNKVQPGNVILVTGAPGSGKSTLLLQLGLHAASLFERYERAEGGMLWIENQELLEHVAARATRLNLDKARIRAAAAYDSDSASALARHDELREDVVVIDVFEPIGISAESIKRTLTRIQDFAKFNECYVFLVYNLPFQGQIPPLVEYATDFHIRIARDNVGERRLIMVDEKLKMSKFYDMTPSGFVPCEDAAIAAELSWDNSLETEPN